jgi:hypothetical protein
VELLVLELAQVQELVPELVQASLLVLEAAVVEQVAV